MSRLVFLLLSFLVLASCVFAQRGTMTSDSELRIKIAYENDHPINAPLRVQLLNGTENMVAETFSDGTGQAVFRSVRGGNYKVKISGVGVADTVSESLTVDPRDRFQVQYVHVKAAGSENEANANQKTPISAAELNVPEKARKEFDRGAEAMGKNLWDEAAKQ